MGNLMTSMWTGVSGLRVNQTSLNTTSHNISNIDTKGYTRQQILMTDGSYNNLGTNHISTYQVGLGSNMQAIRQVRDVFLDKSYRLESGRLNFYQIQSDAATEIETIFGEFGDSTFAVSVDSLWKAINGVAEEPNSIVKRAHLASTASTFISYAKLLSEQLQKYQQKVNEKVQTQVDRINEIGDSIKELNRVIMFEETSGQNANDYRDARNMLLDELGSYVNITYSEDISGMVSVNIEGTQFVTEDRVYHLTTEDIPNEKKVQVATQMNLLISGKGADKLMESIKDSIDKQTAAGGQPDPDVVIGAVKASETYKQLDEIGDLNISYTAGGEYTVTFNGLEVLKTTDGTTNTGVDAGGLLGELQKAIAANPGNDAGVIAAVKGSDTWKELAKFGDIGIQKNGTDYVVNFNGIQLISTPNGVAADSDVVEYEAPPTGFQNVVWEHTGFNVFRLTGEYASYNNTDVGSLKSILIARGDFAADYTDIPQKADYCKPDGSFIDDEHKEAYEKAVAKYNKDLNACLLTSTQAQLDLLVHEIVTTINDTLCPNVDLSEDSVNTLLDVTVKKGATTKPGTTPTITAENGNTYTLDDNLMILDIVNSSIGMDPDETMGEALFNRSNMDRYTKAEMEVTYQYTDENGNLQEETKKVPVYIYNKEYEANINSMYTISQLEVNQKILDDVSKMPLSHNKYSELYGGFDYDTCQKILDLWSTDSIQLSPNVLAPYNFSDYYDAITGNIGTKGGVYLEKLDTLEKTVYEVGTERESILGVASEEELTNLIMFQNAYNASSRYINAINELLETVINIGR